MENNYILKVVNLKDLGEVICVRTLSYNNVSDDLKEILEKIKSDFPHIKKGVLDNTLSHGTGAYNRFMLFDTNCNYFTIKLKPILNKDENNTILHNYFLESCVKDNINISSGVLNNVELFLIKKGMERYQTRKDSDIL